MQEALHGIAELLHLESTHTIVFEYFEILLFLLLFGLTATSAEQSLEYVHWYYSVCKFKRLFKTAVKVTNIFQFTATYVFSQL